MLNQLTNSTPATHVLRPERSDPSSGNLDKMWRKIKGGFLRVSHGRDRMPGFISRVDHYGPALESMSDEDLSNVADSLREQFHLEGFKEELVARSFALIREIASRTVGMRHFDTQLIGGRIMLNGMIAEMETGEGKTLTASLAAGTAALAGVPVHVITVNDYLTSRDAEWIGPVYHALGLKVGCIIHGMTPDDRRKTYECDVVYCTNKEITFDYLKDWITLEGKLNPLRLEAEALYGKGARANNLLLRGLHFAIVDEADSILIDEARTPLIISKSREGEGEQVFMEQAMELSEQLREGIDYQVQEASRKIKITDSGKTLIRELASTKSSLWTGVVRREEIIRLALTARHLFVRDKQYLVRDGKVQIIDEYTGRVMPDRSYEGGLQQLIEVKEGCEITHQPETLARVSYQRFFRRYLHLAGMTGTAKEVRGELYSVYGLLVVRIPTCRKVLRKAYPDQIFSTEEDKWKAVVDTIRKMHKKERPVLVGTGSVAASEKTSQILTAIGLDHQVLNAKQDEAEAEVISHAGEVGAVTIATSMAGRGTDISLGPGVKEKEGLHVILTERQEAGRIDRQLAGRCGRLGDPGSYQAILSFEDPIFERGGGAFVRWVAGRFFKPGSLIWLWLVKVAILKAQRKIEKLHARIRGSLLKEDERRGDMMSFSGSSE